MQRTKDSVSSKSNDVIGETNKKNKQQAALEVVVNNSDKLKAEIIWTLKTISHLPYIVVIQIIQVKTFETILCNVSR